MQIDGLASLSSCQGRPDQTRPDQANLFAFHNECGLVPKRRMKPRHREAGKEQRESRQAASSRHELNRMYTGHTHTLRPRHVHVCRHSIMSASPQPSCCVVPSLTRYLAVSLLRPRTCNLLIKYRMSLALGQTTRRGHDIHSSIKAN